MESIKKTQLEQIRKHLLKYGKITTWAAIQRYRITRLSRYIHTLRKFYKYRITDHWETNRKTGKQFKVYELA